MFSVPAGGLTFTAALTDEQATRRLMLDIAGILQPGDFVTLSGDLGAGKTTFARALIRHLAGDETIEVPSPSFTLMQSYSLPPFPVVHADFYRLSGAAELGELGFDDLPEGAVVLLEWPDRAAGLLPPDRIDVTLTLAPQHGTTFRNARISGFGKLSKRIERLALLRKFLDAAGVAAVPRRHMQGDASTRTYERLTHRGRDMILMNNPRRPDGPPIHSGKPYSEIVHLAEDVAPFVAMANGLRQRGFSAPEIIDADLEHGFLLLEDLGNETVVQGEPPAPIEERYAASVDVLVSLHGALLPGVLPLPGGAQYKLPRYDMEAMLTEAELLLDWYLPMRNATVTDAKRSAYQTLWRETLALATESLSTWVLRDYHSPNLLWIPTRNGVQRVGLLDFQDAVMGPPAYDLASLLQDARVDVPEQLEIALLSRYSRARRAADESFDAPTFVRLYSTMAAQRASKILGIFARLDRRDGKPQYLRHIPRVYGYLQRALAHPALEPLKEWYAVNVPPPQSA